MSPARDLHCCGPQLFKPHWTKAAAWAEVERCPWPSTLRPTSCAHLNTCARSQASSRGDSSHSAMSESQGGSSEGGGSLQGRLRNGWHPPAHRQAQLCRLPIVHGLHKVRRVGSCPPGNNGLSGAYCTLHTYCAGPGGLVWYCGMQCRGPASHLACERAG